MAHRLAQDEGRPINHKRIARIMSEQLVGSSIRKLRYPEHWYRERHKERLSDRRCSSNVLNRDFASSRPLTKLVTDVTWVSFAGGTLYLSTIMDLFDHQIVAYEVKGLYQVLQRSENPKEFGLPKPNLV